MKICEKIKFNGSTFTEINVNDIRWHGGQILIHFAGPEKRNTLTNMCEITWLKTPTEKSNSQKLNGRLFTAYTYLVLCLPTRK